jgi:hypothetical protein
MCVRVARSAEMVVIFRYKSRGKKVPACFVWWLVSHTDEWVKLDKAHAFFMFLLSSVVDNHEDVQVVEDSIY